MRKAINENRTVQLVLAGGLAVLGGLFLLKGGGGESSAEPTASAPSADATGAVPAVPVSTGDGSTTSAAAGQSAAGGSVPAVPAALVPGPGLPKSLLASQQRGEAVALLVARAGGIDDALVRRSVGLLEGVPKLSVHVTRADGVARYAWLTQAVNLTDLPALIILLPRGNTNDAATAATVTYGFRDASSVLQAAKDALYDGPTQRPYHP